MLTTRLARTRLAAIKHLFPVRDRVRQQLQMRQQDDFVVGREQLFKPITNATSAATGVLKKIAAQTEETRRSLETLPAGIAVATTYRRRRPPPLAITSTPEQQKLYVTMADEEELGATAQEPEKELLQEEIQEEIQETLQRQQDIRNTPVRVLKKEHNRLN